MRKSGIRNQIRRLRFEKGEMTQQELADEVGCSRQTIIVLEQERYVPSLLLALRIAKVFAVSVEQVFELAEEQVLSLDP